LKSGKLQTKATKAKKTMDKFQADKLCVREISAADHILMPDFLYHAIFVPPSVLRPSMEITYRPEIYIYINGYGKPGDTGAVAEYGGRAVGMAWARLIHAYGHLDKETPELAISVLPEYRGLGIGTKLMTKLFDLLAMAGYKRISLSVNKNNPAVRFYQRHGYETICEKDDDYIMIKKIEVDHRQ
jgi:ribosomal protein S18 acetylase RimI-like enzyme